VSLTRSCTASKRLQANRLVLPIVVLLGQLSLAACVVSPVYYESNAKNSPIADQAVLDLRSSPAFVLEIDGKALPDPLTTLNGGYSAVREIRLSPGFHRLRAQVWANSLSGYQDLSENFEAGSRYRIVVRQYGYEMSAGLEKIVTAPASK